MRILVFVFERSMGQYIEYSGDSGWVTPDPISNSEVKPSSADDSECENRKPLDKEKACRKGTPNLQAFSYYKRPIAFVEGKSLSCMFKREFIN